MSSQDVKEIEMSMKEAKETVALAKALERLEKNRDFKRLIQEEYLQNEAVRLVHLKADVNVQDVTRQENINRDINGIGSFIQFLKTVMFKADMAMSAIEECEATLDDLRAEGADE